MRQESRNSRTRHERRLDARASKHEKTLKNQGFLMVGGARLELATPCV